MATGNTTLLAGDAGGTSTRLAIVRVSDGALRVDATARFESRGHPSLAAIVHEFRATQSQPVARACFGVAGPVVGGRVETPNLPWVVDAAALAHELGLAEVDVINDLEANAHGIFALSPKDFAVLNAGAAAPGNRAVISAGTGLGEAGVMWDGRSHHPFATEGGHADWAPKTELEAELLRHLARKFGGHVSVERVVSGPGLVNIYEFLRDTGRGDEPGWLGEALAGGDHAAVISTAAMSGRSALCAAALDLFASAYAAEAGNLALKMMAIGGVYLGGGIAPKIIGRLKTPAFVRSFTAKGRLGSLLEAVQVRVVMNDHAALLGAARFAARQASLIPREAAMP